MDTEPVYFKCYQKAARDKNLEFTPKLYEACVGISTAEGERLMRSYFGESLNAEEMVASAYKYFGEFVLSEEIHFRPGAKEAVAFFYNKGLKLAVASSNSRQWVDFLLQKKDLYSYFQSIITSEDVTRHKPDPEPYLRTAKNLETDPSECLVFEDSVPGATAAISAGMRTCVVPDLKQPNTFLREHAFKIYQSLEDIYPDMDDLLS